MDDWCAVSDSLVWEVSMSPLPHLLLLDSPSLFSNFPLSSSLAFKFSTPSVCFAIYLNLPLPVSTKHPAFLSQPFLCSLSVKLEFPCLLKKTLLLLFYMCFSHLPTCVIFYHPSCSVLSDWSVCLSLNQADCLCAVHSRYLTYHVLCGMMCPIAG